MHAKLPIRSFYLVFPCLPPFQVASRDGLTVLTFHHAASCTFVDGTTQSTLYRRVDTCDSISLGAIGMPWLVEPNLLSLAADLNLNITDSDASVITCAYIPQLAAEAALVFAPNQMHVRKASLQKIETQFFAHLPWPHAHTALAHVPTTFVLLSRQQPFLTARICPTSTAASKRCLSEIQICKKLTFSFLTEKWGLIFFKPALLTRRAGVRACCEYKSYYWVTIEHWVLPTDSGLLLLLVEWACRQDEFASNWTLVFRQKFKFKTFADLLYTHRHQVY